MCWLSASTRSSGFATRGLGGCDHKRQEAVCEVWPSFIRHYSVWLRRLARVCPLLGPLLFNVYASPVSDPINSHGLAWRHKTSHRAQHVWLGTRTWSSQPMLDDSPRMVPVERIAAERRQVRGCHSGLRSAAAVKLQSTLLDALCGSRRKPSLSMWLLTVTCALTVTPELSSWRATLILALCVIVGQLIGVFLGM